MTPRPSLLLGRRAGAAALLAAIAAVASCASPPASQGGATATASPGQDGLQRVTVVGNDSLRFVPSRIVARTGRIQVTLRAEGTVPHNLLVPALRQGIEHVDGGGQGSAVLTVPRPGTYRFVCSYHERAGMVGELVVRAGGT